MFEVDGLGYQSPKPIPCEELAAGEVGFLFANIKTVSDAKIGDTITGVENPAAEPLPGFRRDQADGVRRACIRWNRTSTGGCATRSKSCA